MAKFKRAMVHIAIMVTAILIGLAVSGGIPTSRHSDPEQTASESAALTDPIETVQLDTLPTAQSENSACSSTYFAIIETEAGKYCIGNPTALMAGWGPPTESWFHSLGGEFRAAKEDAAPAEFCACVATQPGYVAKTIAKPVDYLVFDDVLSPVVKWACSDQCMLDTNGRSDDD